MMDILTIEVAVPGGDRWSISVVVRDGDLKTASVGPYTPWPKFGPTIPEFEKLLRHIPTITH